MATVEAYINLSSLKYNLEQVKLLAPNSQVSAVIKANAYGHGLVRTAKALSDVDGFSVARLDEAKLLRDAGLDQPIVILEGFSDTQDLQEISHYSLQVVVHHVFQLEILESAQLPTPIDVWLKIDSGMHRLGIKPGQAQSAWWRLQDANSVAIVRLMTHLASSDEFSSEQTNKQTRCFQAATAGLQAERSIANSAGIIHWPDTHANWVRPGIMLYGVSPILGKIAGDFNLKPVMTLKSQIISINQFREGDPIGYGASWVCPEDMPIGVVACGYGDGYPRHAQLGTPVLIRGQRVPLIGLVSMDSICVDLRGIDDIDIGEEVTLWGDGLPVEEVAQHASTVAYELLCGVSQRVRCIEID